MARLELFLNSADYTKFKYPAGELQVRLTEETVARLSQCKEVAVIARIKELEQVIELCLLWDAVGEVTPKSARRSVVLPYLPFARADRRFVAGDCFGLKVFAEIMETLKAPIVTLDVHSAVSQTKCSNLINVSALPLIADAISKFAEQHKTNSITVLFPDEGASKRYQLPSTIDGIDISVLHCAKKRDPVTGKLNSFAVPPVGDFPRNADVLAPVLIIDDICDGGGTFVGIADELKEYSLRLGLYVTHGIFAKGLDKLSSRFGTIYTTDSFVERESGDFLHVLPSLPWLMAASPLQPRDSRSSAVPFA